jgi:uncharacterized protein
VDILRGWAILGVVIMNYMEFAKFNTAFVVQPKTDVWGSVTFNILNIFFESKSWTLLSVLFGYGFAVIIGKFQREGYNPVKFFAGRMFWLFVLAFINSCFFFGDILKDYAFMGLLFLLFYRAKGKATFVLALIIIFITPAIIPLLRFIPYDMIGTFNKILPLFHSSNVFNVFSFNLQGTYVRQILQPFYAIACHLIILACMLLGFSAYHFDVLHRLNERKKYIKLVFWFSLLFSVLMILLFIATARFNWGYIKYYFPLFMPILGTMLFISSGICWLYISGKLKGLFRAFGYTGKMTLTNYMVQNVISMFIFSGAGFAVYNTWHPAAIAGFAIGIFILQVYFSKWWLTRYNYGPVEWVWRQLSYGKRLSNKKAG